VCSQVGSNDQIVILLFPGSSHLNETYAKILIGKHLSDRFPVHNRLNQGDALTPLLMMLIFASLNMNTVFGLTYCLWYF
jgi:hypothetical protein